MELDGRLYPLKPMTALYIKPECRHRAIGRLRVNIIAIPAFDISPETPAALDNMAIFRTLCGSASEKRVKFTG